MKLAARFLIDVVTVNSWEVVTQIEVNAGDAQTLYFQLVDASLDRADQGFSPAGRRYIPPSGTTVRVTFMNVDDAKKIVRAASQPFAPDASIWSVPLLASDPITGTVALKIVVTEPTRTLTFQGAAASMLRVS